RVLGLSALGLRLEVVDEGAEGRRAAALEAAREVDRAKAVRERLLSRGPDRDPGVRAHGVQQAADRVRDRAVVAPGVEPAEHVERAGDRALGRAERSELVVAETPERVEPLHAIAEREQRVVPEREQRPAQRREDAELVVGPLDRGERVPDREDLLALVERAP